MSLIERFVFEKVIDNDIDTKKVTLLGTIEGQLAILSIEKLPFDASKEFSDYKSLGLDQIKSLDRNDIYSWNLATMIQDLETSPSAKVDLIYPATETHLKKYEKAKKRYIVETPELYRKYVVPYISTMKGDRIKWVRQILHEGVEADRVLVRVDDEKNGFVLLPNLKWDRKNLETLYLVAIVIRDDISSVRDFTEEHIPMLEFIRKTILDTVYEKYGLTSSELKIFIHYQPSYYHFHIHVAHVQLERHDFGTSLFLDWVIDQLKLLGPKGFSESTFNYLLSERHDLWTNGFSKELK